MFAGISCNECDVPVMYNVGRGPGLLSVLAVTIVTVGMVTILGLVVVLHMYVHVCVCTVLIT